MNWTRWITTTAFLTSGSMLVLAIIILISTEEINWKVIGFVLIMTYMTIRYGLDSYRYIFSKDDKGQDTTGNAYVRRSEES